MPLKLGIQHWVLKYYQIYSNNDPVLTLTIFMTWSNLFPNASAWAEAYTGERYRTNSPLAYLYALGPDGLRHKKFRYKV